MPTETWLKHCISSVLCGRKFLCGAIFHIFVGMHSEWAFDLEDGPLLLFETMEKNLSGSLASVSSASYSHLCL